MNTALELLREYDKRGYSEGWGRKVDALLASQQGEQATSAENARVHPEQAEGAQGEQNLFEHEKALAAYAAKTGKPLQLAGKCTVQDQYVFGWMDHSRAALAQRSPALVLERPEVVAFIHERTGAVANADMVRTMEEGSVPSGYTIGLMTVAQYDSDVGALRDQANRAQYRANAWEAITKQSDAERDAAQARVAELEQSQGAEMFLTLTGEITQLKAKLAELEEQQSAPVAHRLINPQGEVMTDWHDGPPPENFTDLCGVAMAGTRVELAFAQAGQVRAIQVYKLGIHGKAYDLPENKRAYTYAEQPDNLVASRLGHAYVETSLPYAGDSIDRGLILLRELQDIGFGVFELSAAPAQGGRDE